MRDKNRHPVYIFSSIMILSLILVGCGLPGTDHTKDSGKETYGSQRISEDVITITLGGICNNKGTTWSETTQYQEYVKRLGIKIDATTYTTEQWSYKFPAMLASDTMPDIISECDLPAHEVEKYGREGYFLDISKYLDIMPNFSYYLQKYPEYEATIRNDEGAIYALSRLNIQDDIDKVYKTFINTDWLDRLGLETPRTLDDLYDVLKAFKEEDADGNADPDDEIPMGYDEDIWWFTESIILWGHGIYDVANVSDYHLVVDDGGKVVLGDATENYKDFLKYMHRLYEEGLINQDAFLISREELYQRFDSGKVGVMVNNTGLPGTPAQQVASWEILPGMVDEKYNPEPIWVVAGKTSNLFKYAVNANTKYPEEICRLIDYCFSEEGAISTFKGYEGVTFDYVDVMGYQTFDTSAYREGGRSIDWQNKHVAVNSLSFLQVGDKGFHQFINDFPEEEPYPQECIEHWGGSILSAEVLRAGVKIIEAYPAVKYTSAELAERDTLYPYIVNYLKDTKAQFIMGEMDVDTEWEAHIDKLNAMGLERLMEIEQAAYDRYIDASS